MFRLDYLIDDYATLSAIPIEVKSGKDYTIHSALSNFVKNEDYHIQKAFVVSNERTVSTKGRSFISPSITSCSSKTVWRIARQCSFKAGYSRRQCLPAIPPKVMIPLYALFERV
jgi:hypothetical protein